MLGGRDGKGQKGDSKKEFNKSFGNNSTSGEASQVAVVVKNPPANAGDIRDGVSIPESGRSAGGGHGNPLQYSCVENPMDRGAWQTTVQGVAKNWAQRSNDNSGLRCGAYFCMIFTICKCSLAGCPDPFPFLMELF